MSGITKKIEELDNYGPLTDPMPEDAPRYNFLGIRDYCRKHNKSMADMTFAEFEKFRSDK
jgi:hypothetical protein